LSSTIFDHCPAPCWRSVSSFQMIGVIKNSNCTMENSSGPMSRKRVARIPKHSDTHTQLSTISASAVTRTAAPRDLPINSKAAITTIAASAIHSTIDGTSGVNAMP